MISNWVIPLVAAGVLGAVQPAEAKAPPKSAAAPAPKAIPRTTITSSGPGTAALVLRPAAPAASRTGFVLRSEGPGRLTLAFESAEPGLRLDPQGLVIQISAPPGVEITPSVVTSADWPKGANRISLKVEGLKGHEAQLAASATYNLCDTRGCRRSKGFFTLRP